MKKSLMLILLFNYAATECSLFSRLALKAKLPAALKTLLVASVPIGLAGLAVNKAKIDGDKAGTVRRAQPEPKEFTYAEAQAKYPFTSRLMMHYYKHHKYEYTKPKLEVQETSTDAYRSGWEKVYFYDYTSSFVGGSRVVDYQTSSRYQRKPHFLNWWFKHKSHWEDESVLVRIQLNKLKQKSSVSRIIERFETAPLAVSNGAPNQRRLDDLTVCTKTPKTLECNCNLTESLKRAIAKGYAEKTGDHTRDVFGQEHAPAVSKERWTEEATMPASERRRRKEDSSNAYEYAY
jgi:hypothetical protein